MSNVTVILLMPRRQAAEEIQRRKDIYSKINFLKIRGNRTECPTGN